MTISARFFLVAALAIVCACTTTSHDVVSCADFAVVAASVRNLNLSDSWDRLDPVTVEHRWGGHLIEANSDFLVFEETPIDVLCGCHQVLHFDNQTLSTVSVVRNEPDYPTAARHRSDLHAAIRPADQAQVDSLPEIDSQRWMLPDERGWRRQLEIQTTISKCGAHWQLRAVISLFRTTANVG